MKGLIILLLLLIGSKASAQFPLTTSEMKEDFLIFKNSIKEIHPGLYWYADSAEIAKRFDKIERSINEEMELKDFYVLLQEFYAGIRCGHSWMSMPWKWRTHIDKGPYRIPINFFIEKDRIVTMRDLTDDKSINEGMEVLSINNIKTADLLETLTKLTPTDGYTKTRQIRIVAGNFSRYFQSIYGLDSIFKVELRDMEETKIVTLKGLPNDEANKRSEERYAHLEREVTPMLSYSELDGKIGYIKIQSFDKDDIKEGKQRYKKFLKQSFAAVNDRNLDKLIIDLRGNSGGEDNYGATLARYLLDKPFSYYNRMEAVTNHFHYNEYSRQRGFNTMGKLLKKDRNKPGFYTYNYSRQVKEQKPIQNDFNGKVVVLVDGGTFSAASEVASILHTNKRATFIGDETGGGYYGNNSAMMYGIQLPNSCINYYLPVIRYYVAVDYPEFEGRGLIPDIQIPLSFESYSLKADEILEAAINELEK